MTRVATWAVGYLAGIHALLALSGCGLKGDLYLPEPEKVQPAAPGAIEQTPSADPENGPELKEEEKRPRSNPPR